MARILIVDDHPTNREFLATLLGYRQHTIIEAGDGAEALDKVSQIRPDLVIADILMPTMDGYQFVRHLRAIPSIAHTRVIFYTATYHEHEVRSLADRCGVTHVLTKPCEPETVLKIVDEILDENIESATRPVPEQFDRDHIRLITDKLARVAGDLGQVNERFAELIEINLQMASEKDPRQLLERVCHSARKLVGARHALLVAGKKDGKETILYTTSGFEPSVRSSLGTPSLTTGMTGAVYAERKPCRLNGSAELDLQTLGLPTTHPPVQTLLVAPVMSIQHSYGWICLTGRLGDTAFTDEDQHLLSILAAQVGRIYENGSLYTELEESEQRFRQLAENIRNAVFFLTNPELTEILYVNPAYESIWGRSCESLYRQPGSWLDAVHPDYRDRVIAGFEQTRTRGKVNVTYQINRPDGTRRWIRAYGFPIYNSAGQLYRVAGIANDITDSLHAEEKIRRLNRVYSVLSGINTAIVRIRNKQELFSECCRIAVEAGLLRMAWIGLVSGNGEKIIPQASHGHVDGYLEQPDLSFIDADDTLCAASGLAVKRRQPVIRNNIAEENEKVPWKKEALSRGYHSMAAFPLIVSGSVTGTISLYANEPDFFVDDEIRLLVELASDISYAIEFIENEKRLHYLAYHDPLTGLANRASLYNALGMTIARRGIHALPFALLLININDFRNVNDTIGHQNGDELIRQVAFRLKSTVFASDTVAGLGGDDFAILLPRLADRDHIEVVIAKILQSFRSAFVISGIPINIEVTVGVALYPDHGNCADLLWQHADVALRAGKETHRTCIFYETAIDHYDPAQLSLINELHKALDQNELVLHYQPKIDLHSGTTVGVEALVRWQHPERGLLYPDRFIPLIENTGLIDPLTIWVLGNAFRQMHFWHKSGYPLELSVNLSARNLVNPDMRDEIVDLTRSSRLPLQSLIIEITESAIMVDPINAKRVLCELHDAGINFSVDDFGIGQASLNYLKELPVSKMKIDKSFVMEIDNPRNFAIVRSAVELGHNLGLSVTAEGVETARAFELLKDMGCDRAQGYYFTPPLPPDRLIAWLKTCPWPVAGREQ